MSNEYYCNVQSTGTLVDHDAKVREANELQIKILKLSYKVITSMLLQEDPIIREENTLHILDLEVPKTAKPEAMNKIVAKLNADAVKPEIDLKFHYDEADSKVSASAQTTRLLSRIGKLATKMENDFPFLKLEANANNVTEPTGSKVVSRDEILAIRRSAVEKVSLKKSKTPLKPSEITARSFVDAVAERKSIETGVVILGNLRAVKPTISKHEIYCREVSHKVTHDNPNHQMFATTAAALNKAAKNKDEKIRFSYDKPTQTFTAYGHFDLRPQLTALKKDLSKTVVSAGK